MFVRWKVQQRANGRANGRKSKPVSLYVAYLVESVRVNGKPRQKTLAYLGSIKSTHLEIHQGYFWKNVQTRMRLLTLTDEQRVKVEQAIAKRVPKP